MKISFCDICKKEMTARGNIGSPGDAPFKPKAINISFSSGVRFSGVVAPNFENSDICISCLDELSNPMTKLTAVLSVTDDIENHTIKIG